MKTYLRRIFSSTLLAVIAASQLISVPVVASDTLTSAKQSSSNIADFDSKTVQFNRRLNPKVEKFFDSNPGIENIEIRTFDTTRINFNKSKFKTFTIY